MTPRRRALEGSGMVGILTDSDRTGCLLCPASCSNLLANSARDVTSSGCFVISYNTVRPHRSLGRRTPQAAFEAREKRRPNGPVVEIGNRRVRLGRVGKTGSARLRSRGRMHHIGIGSAYRGWPLAMLIDGLDMEIVALDGTPLRRLVLDPARDHQRQA